MDYCTAKTLLKDAPKNRNIFNELFYGGKIVGYMEKHDIYEIINEVLIRVGIDQPNNDNVAEYLARKITEIAETFTRNKIHLDLQATPENASLFIRDFAETFKIPILQWNGLNEDPIKREHDINKFLKERQFDKKNLIFCDFEMKNGKDSILRITRNKSQVFCANVIKSSSDCDVILPSKCNSVHFLNRIHKFIGNLKPARLAKQNWPLRCLIVGRIGSGRDIQGALMAQEFGLVLIVLDYFLIQYHKKPSLAAKTNIGFLGFLQERLLKPDCISNGWVIVSNPWKLDHLQVLMDHFILKPNNVFFLHTSEQRSRNTIIKNSNSSNLFYFDKQDQGNFINYQMNLYNCHKKEFDKYFIKNKQKILHIDGNNSVNSIKNLIWAELAKC
ncbi:unnamed protein product [Diamesa hyperborea]